MAVTTVYTYDLNGSKKDFDVPFEYLARRFVQVTLIGQDRKTLTLSSEFRFISKTIIQTTEVWGPADGYERIEIRRNTSTTDRLVDFADGSILRANELNISQVQTLHVAEEARNMVVDTIGADNNGNLDARGRRLVNLADADELGDAVTLRQEKAWGESALNQANRSQSEANRSQGEADRATARASEAASNASAVSSWTSETKAARDAAKVSETNSKDSEAKAKTSETNAKASENSATGSALAANQSAINAGAHADRAKAEADKLASTNVFASNLDPVNTTSTQVALKATTRLLAPGNFVHQLGTFMFNGNVLSNSSGSTYIQNQLVVNQNKLTIQGEPGGYPTLQFNHTEANGLSAWRGAQVRYEKAANSLYLYTYSDGGASNTGTFQFTGNGIFWPSGGIRTVNASITTEGSGKFIEAGKNVVRERSFVRSVIWDGAVSSNTVYDFSSPVQPGDMLVAWFSTSPGAGVRQLQSQASIYAGLPITSGSYLGANVGDYPVTFTSAGAIYAIRILLSGKQFQYTGQSGFSSWWLNTIERWRVEA